MGPWKLRLDLRKIRHFGTGLADASAGQHPLFSVDLRIQMRKHEFMGILGLFFSLLSPKRKSTRPRHNRTGFVPKRRPELVRSNAPAQKTNARSAKDLRASIAELPEAKVIQILDGDSIVVARSWISTEVRLDSIDCPEGDQPWGDTAKYGLIKLVGGKTVRLEVHGTDPHGRTLATVLVQDKGSSEWTNINERMVVLGHAWVMRKHFDHLPKDRQAALLRLESWAKSKKVGLWKSSSPTPPWKWRNGDC